MVSSEVTLMPAGASVYVHGALRVYDLPDLVNTLPKGTVIRTE